MSAIAVPADASVVECEISIPRAGGRPIVHCDIQHFAPSGLTTAELFAELRPQLVEAIQRAAASDPGGPLAPRPVTVQMDVGAADPGMSLVVYDPAACVADMDGQLDRLQRIAERVIAAERAGGGL